MYLLKPASVSPPAVVNQYSSDEVRILNMCQEGLGTGIWHFLSTIFLERGLAASTDFRVVEFPWVM